MPQSISILKKPQQVTIKVELVGMIEKEKSGTYTSYCPALDVYSMGKTKREARGNLIEAMELFIQDCFENDTLLQVLKESGFFRRESPTKTKPDQAAKTHPPLIRLPLQIPILA